MREAIVSSKTAAADIDYLNARFSYKKKLESSVRCSYDRAYPWSHQQRIKV